MSVTRARIPFADFDLQYENMREDILDAINRILGSGQLILREPVHQFELQFAKFVGVKHAIGVSNGTDAVRLALLACEVRPGDQVITVAHTFVSTVSEIVHAGATPVLVDIAGDHNMDVTKLPAAINDRTRVIVPVHMNGRACEMNTIMRIAAEHNLIVVEDAAQALGCKYKRQSVGSFGTAATFSFYPSKILGALGDAGAVVTNSDEIAQKVRLLRDHGRTDRTTLRCWGYNCRLDGIQAAVLALKLKGVPQWLDRRRALAAIYCAGFRKLPQVRLPCAPGSDPDFFDVYQNFVIEAEERDELQNFLCKNGVETLVYWPKPLHRQAGLGLEEFSLPMTESLSRMVLSLPMYTNLADESASYVVDKIHDYYARMAGKKAAMSGS